MFRAGYALRKRTGTMRRALPATSWDAQPIARFLRDPSLADAEAYAAHRAEHGARFLIDSAERSTFRRCFDEWDRPRRHPESRYRMSSDGRWPVATANRVCEGVFRFFERQEINLGCPPDWHRNPVTGDDYPPDRHWSEIGDFAAGDIKYVWEPSRFAWVYPLVRAYWRTEDERYPRLFWELVDDWRRMNPPQQGVNWKCGQEIALRVMACCFGLYGFADSPEMTAERVGRLAQMLAVSGERIAANLSYALSQQNNHGISEATGLWTLGLLFPEFAAAPLWRRIGREALEAQCRKLIDEDGAFSQHSVNYQRVMLHACLWALRLGDLHGQPLSDELRDRVGRAGTFLWHLQDEATGRLPRHGANDGALVLPLTNCEHQDYRPVVQASGWLRNAKRRFASGPWDEELLWLFGPDALTGDVDGEQRGDWQAEQGGYCVLRSESGHVFTRAGSYRHRPADADMLHVDVWWRGQNVALDAGTYSYNAPPPWDSPLARTASHNTVTVDRRDQMDRAGRFLWLPWISGRQSQLSNSPHGHLTYWEGTHDGYRRLPSPVTYHRGILRIGGEHWLVVDALSGAAPHAYRLHWLLPDVPHVLDEERWHLRLETPAGPYDVSIAATAESLCQTGGRGSCRAGRGLKDSGSAGASPSHDASFRSGPVLSCVRGEPERPRGWFAPYYGDKQPALSLACEADGRSATFWTLLGPSIVDVQADARQFSAATEHWTCRLQCADPGRTASTIIQSVTVTGALTDALQLIR
jgi:asparagine synthase (glutamine-hydrolysing)